jgi:hypothetical protein
MAGAVAVRESATTMSLAGRMTRTIGNTDVDVVDGLSGIAESADR